LQFGGGKQTLSGEEGGYVYVFFTDYGNHKTCSNYHKKKKSEMRAVIGHAQSFAKVDYLTIAVRTRARLHAAVIGRALLAYFAQESTQGGRSIKSQSRTTTRTLCGGKIVSLHDG